MIITPNPMGNFNDLKGSGITKYSSEPFKISDTNFSLKGFLNRLIKLLKVYKNQ